MATIQELFGNSSDEYLKVHDQGPGHADVTEGSSGVWERLNYDWSDPTHVVMKTTDSNGTTDLDVVVVRDGKNVKGRALGLTVGLFGKALEARKQRGWMTEDRHALRHHTRRHVPGLRAA